MTNYLIFNGKDSRDFGIKIENHNNYSSPQRRVESIPVPGRTGNILVDEGAYDNVKFDYELILDCRGSDLISKSKQIASWLHNDYTYRDLKFSNDLGTVWKAVVINKIDIGQMLRKFGRAMVTFEAYKTTNALSKSILNVVDECTYFNDTGDIIRPILKVTGDGDCSININNQEVKIKGLEGHLTIDCFNMDCYKEEDGNIVNCNNKMYGMFPKLETGENKITVLGCEIGVIVL